MRTPRQTFKLRRRHFQACRIRGRVQIRLATKTCRRARRRNVVDHCLITFERSASPIAADQIEHPMLNRIPLGGSRRVMCDRDRQPALVSQTLQSDFEPPTPVAITAAAIALNQQMLRRSIDLLSNGKPPLPDRGDGKTLAYRAKFPRRHTLDGSRCHKYRKGSLCPPPC